MSLFPNKFIFLLLLLLFYFPLPFRTAHVPANAMIFTHQKKIISYFFSGQFHLNFYMRTEEKKTFEKWQNNSR